MSEFVITATQVRREPELCTLSMMDLRSSFEFAKSADVILGIGRSTDNTRGRVVLVEYEGHIATDHAAADHRIIWTR